MKKIKYSLLILAVLISSVVMAQPKGTVGSASGQVGNTVTVPVDFVSDGNIAALQFRVNFDNANLTVDLSACGATLGGTVVTCTDQTTYVQVTGVSLTFPATPIPTGSLGTIGFTINAGAIGTVYPLAITNQVYGNVAGTSVPPVTAAGDDGSVTVVAGPQPDYSSAPVATTTLNFSGAVTGTAPTATVDITNSGDATSTLTGSCALSGADAASFNIVSGSPFSVVQGATAATVTVDCSTAAVGTFNASLDCTHDGSTAPSPASYPLVCNIAAITPQYNSTPAGGSTIAMGSILQGGTNPTATVDINNDAGDATTTLTGTCTALPPFIVTNGTFSVLQGAAAATVNIACDATVAPAAYAEDLTCTHNGSNVASPVTYPMTCEVLAAAATGSQNPPAGTALNITVPPGGSGTTTVIFSETGGQGVAITDLTCSVTGPDFVITSPVTFPATIPTGGSLPVVITFTDPGGGSAVPDTLTCSYTDGTGVVDLTWPLNFSAQAINVPTLSMMGYLLLTLGFGLIGFLAFRRRA